MDTEIEARATKAIADKVTPNVVVGYVLEDNQPHYASFGRHTYDKSSPEVSYTSVYDIASITKSIPTSSIILWLVDQKRLSLDDQVIDYLPELKNKHREAMTIRHLLTYTVVLDLQGAGLSTFAEKGIGEVERVLFQSELKAAPGEIYWYTNAPAILLGMIVERIFQKSLNIVADELFFGPLQMIRTTFTPEQFDPKDIVPSEVGLQGEVRGQPSDETARAFYEAGRSTGAAGLFSTAEDLLVFAKMMANRGTYEGRRYLSPKIIEELRTNQVPHLKEKTGLGWEIGRPYMGKYGDRLFGKGGFTGCGVVVDIEKKRAVAVMASYTYPKRRGLNDRGLINSLRGDIADIILGA